MYASIDAYIYMHIFKYLSIYIIYVDISAHIYVNIYIYGMCTYLCKYLHILFCIHTEEYTLFGYVNRPLNGKLYSGRDFGVLFRVQMRECGQCSLGLRLNKIALGRHGMAWHVRIDWVEGAGRDDSDSDVN